MKTELDQSSARWWRHVRKNSKGKPLAAVLIQIRTLSTAVEILDWIQDIPFSNLSMSLYFYCQDIGMANFTRAYESQLELAAANPEKFALGLHKFYTEMAKKIQKEDLFDLFFEFYYRCVKMRVVHENEKVNDTVTTAYQNLLIQQLEYLRPEKYNLKTFVAGRKTTGELLIREELFPNFDVPIYQLRCELDDGRKFKDAEERLYELYRKAGFNIYDEDDQMRIVAQDKIHTTTCTTLLPFINEFTYDMLPQTPYNANSNIVQRLRSTINNDTVVQALTKRRKTLPTNGVCISFAQGCSFSSLHFKELLFDNSIYMLYRLETVNGDLCGLYDTKDRFFYSIFQGSLDHVYLTNAFEGFILYCYASQVIGAIYPLSDLNAFVQIIGESCLIAEAYDIGGKLRNTYDRQYVENRENYEAAEASVQGYIRRLPTGQHASKDAVELAESLGYELEANETYVRPFVKQVFRLKERPNESRG